MVRSMLSMLASLLLVQMISVGPVSAAEKLSITDRQQILFAKTVKAWKKKHLTMEEYRDLQDDFTSLEERIEKMKAKNGGSLSYDNIESIERDLNDISVQLHKKQLAKRVAD
ncbi:MAG: hypothetical protein K2X29_11330 [Candidatus Obscuribacterales bacterium]|nr:hypothetical protein [Candidatus Obscuribacterales bacterium]